MKNEKLIVKIENIEGKNDNLDNSAQGASEELPAAE